MGQTCLQSFTRISILQQISPISAECGRVVFYCWSNKKKAKPLYFIGAGEETNANISGFLGKTQMQMYPISWIKLNLTRVHI